MNQVLKLQPRDPLIARDGRPFGSDSGSRMRPLEWPLPSMVAGSIRTALGRLSGGNFSDPKLLDSLKSLRCHGPLPASNGQLFLPAANDAVRQKNGRCVRLKPEQSDSTDLYGGLWPVMPPSDVQVEKFDSAPAWWSMARMEEWLLMTSETRSDFFADSKHFRSVPATDWRSHVKINPASQTSEDEMLFSTAGLVLDQILDSSGSAAEESFLVTRVLDQAGHFAEVLPSMHLLQPCGGERRLIEINAHQADPAVTQSFRVPSAIRMAFQNVSVGARVKMVLATPAIFDNGWCPGWLNEDGSRVGTPPAISGSGLKLRLVSFCNQRWEAVSGWSYEHRGPKAIRRMVPAGAVYYFQVEQTGSASQETLVDDLWLQPVSDNETEQNDGFGLATWGRW